ncbi:TIGR03086 family metal-binding protein [Streptacidiphilus jiangxiensis]|uniref:TIGR03086 family protein n=1 Tax=Streptacidiphilus jiangxiensis TaxID=235985 RepID=A0A1H7LZV2_STRJI|nr:TIGR03086 family metal-binding protein [Streptacidiphilus jiangxiensis]SEL04005.1 TIGR03086 family protein [Streptacidiphilus jiangxiensis]
MTAPTPVELADQLTRAARNLQAHATERDLTGKRERPTPCAEFTVHQLCEHLLGAMVASGYAAAKKPVPAEAPVKLTDAPWRAYPPVVDRLVAAWSKPEAWEGEAPFAGEARPARFVGMVTVMELTVHGWDLAQATGQSFKAEDDVVATAADVAALIAEGARAGGAFGPQVAASPDATALERLLAFTGRRV